ncbi:unnamed protein product [Camellia sinensis]
MSSKGQHLTVPLSVLLNRELANEKIERPEISHGQACQSKKGEDFTFLKTECQRVVAGDDVSTYSVFAFLHSRLFSLLWYVWYGKKKARKKWKGNRSGRFHRLGGRRGGKGEEDVLSSPTHQNSYNQGWVREDGKERGEERKKVEWIFEIFDGHNGSAAAIYSEENLLNNVLAAIPSDLNRDEWVAALPRALVAGFVKTDKDFQEKAQTSGTTVTFMIIEGWVLTVASVGDSRCILESAEGEIYYLSADHRLERSVEERERITASGGEVGRLNTGGES